MFPIITDNVVIYRGISVSSIFSSTVLISPNPKSSQQRRPAGEAQLDWGNYKNCGLSAFAVCRAVVL